MGKRLPPGEAERRAAERARRLWSGEAYSKYNPTIEGFGSASQWQEFAEAMASGRGSFKPVAGAKSNKRINPDLVLLGLTEMPAHIDALKKAFRTAIFKSHPDYGGTNEAARNTMAAYKRLVESY